MQARKKSAAEIKRMIIEFLVPGDLVVFTGLALQNIDQIRDDPIVQIILPD